MSFEPHRNATRSSLRRMLLSGVAALGLGALVFAPAYAQQDPAPAGDVTPATPADVQAGFADMVDQVLPAVVSVRVRAIASETVEAQEQQQVPDDNPLAPFLRGTPEDQPQYVYGQGSAFFISADGYLVTNNHVVQGADRVQIVLTDGTSYPARVIGTDPRTDVALIKVDEDREFPFVSFAPDSVRIGDWVIAVGNPFGLGGTVTAGIVSALGRDIGAGPYDDFIQMDAAINRGNSGGPAFNTLGQVVGVTTAIFSPESEGGSVGIGFAIPTHVVQGVVADLKETGTVQRGWLGVNIQSIDPDIAAALGLPDSNGAMVVEAVPGTPAADAGLEPRDVILEIDGFGVQDPRQLSRLIADYDPGSQVALTVWRDGAQQTINVTLGQIPGEEPRVAQAEPQAEEAPQVQGLGLAIASASQVQPGAPGVVIVDVAPNGAAAARGLGAGDVILEVDGERVNSPQQVSQLLQSALAADHPAILMLIQSGDAQGYVAFDLGDVTPPPANGGNPPANGQANPPAIPPAQ